MAKIWARSAKYFSRKLKFFFEKRRILCIDFQIFFEYELAWLRAQMKEQGPKGANLKGIGVGAYGGGAMTS